MGEAELLFAPTPSETRVSVSTDPPVGKAATAVKENAAKLQTKAQEQAEEEEEEEKEKDEQKKKGISWEKIEQQRERAQQKFSRDLSTASTSSKHVTAHTSPFTGRVRMDYLQAQVRMGALDAVARSRGSSGEGLELAGRQP